MCFVLEFSYVPTIRSTTKPRAARASNWLWESLNITYLHFPGIKNEIYINCMNTPGSLEFKW